MISQHGSQTIIIHILLNIPRSIDNQATKCSQLIEYNKADLLFKNHAENEAGRLAPDLFLFFRKPFYDVRQVVCSLFSIILIALNFAYIKN